VVGVTAAIEARDLYRFYHAGDDETLALRGVSLRADPGEMVAVAGPSGSGKSTLLACLAGLDEPDGGVVRVAGELLSRRSETERAGLRARHIGVLFQTHNLVDDLTVGENLALVQRLAHRPDHRTANRLLDAFGLADRKRALPRTLSGGEAARAGLVVALANQPSVVLADEPTGELDSELTMSVVDLLRAQAHAGAAVIVVTHDPALAARADQNLRLHDGRLEP
jgi:putative ABC transport system ATP-binding protein